MSRPNDASHGPVICYVTDRHSLSEVESTEQWKALLSKIVAAAEAGVDWIQIREKDLSGKDCSALAREALRHAARSSTRKATATRIVVNDRLDLALAEGAGGVHLGEKSLPLAEAKRLARNHRELGDFLIGVSCHSLQAALAAASGGADYLLFGPVFATPSKASFGEPQGLERLAEVCSEVAIPVLAVGGIIVANAAECLDAGASGIAAIRLFQASRDISSLVQSLRKLKR